MICATQGREEFLIKKWISQLVHNTWKMRKGPLHHLSLQASVFYFCCCCCCCCCCCGENEGGIYFFSLTAGILLLLEEGLVRDEMARWQKKIKTVETNDLTFPSRKLFLLLLAWGRWRYSLQNCFSGLIYQPCLRRRVRQSIKKISHIQWGGNPLFPPCGCGCFSISLSSVQRSSGNGARFILGAEISTLTWLGRNNLIGCGINYNIKRKNGKNFFHTLSQVSVVSIRGGVGGSTRSSLDDQVESSLLLRRERSSGTIDTHFGMVDLRAVAQQGPIFPPTWGGRVQTHRRMRSRVLEGFELPLWLLEVWRGPIMVAFFMHHV